MRRFFRSVAVALLILTLVRQGASAAEPVRLPGKGAAQHPFLYAGEWDTRKALQSMFIVRDGRIAWSYSIPLHTETGGIQGFDDATLLSNGNVIFSRMSGAGEVPIPTPVTGTHGPFRHIRMTPAGTLLVPHLGEGKVVEYELGGKVLWSVEAKSPWSAVGLKNGNTLIAGDWSGHVREVNPKGETVWEVAQKDVPDFKQFNFQTATRLANVNTVITNWCAGNPKTEEWAGTVQVFEVTPEKKIVWVLSSWADPDLGPATSIQLLDEPGVVENGDFQR